VKHLQKIATCLILILVVQSISCKKEIFFYDGQENKPPIANAGADQIITLPKDSVLLDGSLSSDPDGSVKSFHWTKIAGPMSSDIIKPDSSKTLVNALGMGVYKFELTVTDNGGLKAKDTVLINVSSNQDGIDGLCDGITNRPLINAQLIPVSTLPHDNAEMVGVIGNKLFFLSSSCNNCYGISNPVYNTVDIYNVGTNTWSSDTLSEARNDIAVTTCGNKIFFAGGSIYEDVITMSISSAVDIYDASSNTWSVERLRSPKYRITAAAIGSKVLFAGGMSPGAIVNDVDIFDVNTHLWSKAALSEARYWSSSVSLNNKVYFAGGSTIEGGTLHFSYRIDIYDNETGGWSASALHEPTIAMAAIADNNKIYWAGGYRTKGTNTYFSAKVEFKDVTTNTSSFACMCEPKVRFSAVKKDSMIIFFIGTFSNKFDIYNEGTNTWSVGVLPKNMYGQAMSMDNVIYVNGHEESSGRSKLWKLKF
jgi:N-acetylneuraminic acid mutarotase